MNLDGFLVIHPNTLAKNPACFNFNVNAVSETKAISIPEKNAENTNETAISARNFPPRFILNRFVLHAYVLQTF